MISVGAAVGLAKKGRSKSWRQCKRKPPSMRGNLSSAMAHWLRCRADQRGNLAENVATAHRIAVTTGMGENQAARLTFALASADAMPEADTFAEAYKAGVVQDPDVLLPPPPCLRPRGKDHQSRAAQHRLRGRRGVSEQGGRAALGIGPGRRVRRSAGISERELLAGTAINATVLDPTGGAARGGTAMRALARARRTMGGKQEEATAYTEEEFQCATRKP